MELEEQMFTSNPFTAAEHGFKWGLGIGLGVGAVLGLTVGYFLW